MTYTILVVKETRAGEQRVSLVPSDVTALTSLGHLVYVEQGAGHAAGFSDEAYQQAGAELRLLANETINAYKNLFDHINLIVRAKRPSTNRESLENQALASGCIMIGALDPMEQHATHVAEYHQAGVIAYSIDQLILPPDDPMNILAAMSRIAGRLALLDAKSKFVGTLKKVVIIGFGTVGQASFSEAIQLKIPATVILSNEQQAATVRAAGGSTIILNRNLSLAEQQSIIKNAVIDANIVITSARKPNQVAPVLIPTETLLAMQAGSVIVDMAISEGGNVQGAMHDASLTLGNNIIVTNTSGYPKAMPHESSLLWSKASLNFINLLNSGNPIPLKPL